MSFYLELYGQFNVCFPVSLSKDAVSDGPGWEFNQGYNPVQCVGRSGPVQWLRRYLELFKHDVNSARYHVGRLFDYYVFSIDATICSKPVLALELV